MRTSENGESAELVVGVFPAGADAGLSAANLDDPLEMALRVLHVEKRMFVQALAVADDGVNVSIAKMRSLFAMFDEEYIAGGRIRDFAKLLQESRCSEAT